MTMSNGTFYTFFLFFSTYRTKLKKNIVRHKIKCGLNIISRHVSFLVNILVIYSHIKFTKLRFKTY